MDQSESNSKEGEARQQEPVVLPRRSFTVELVVGIFTLLALAAAAYLSIGLGDLKLWQTSDYTIFAEFDNISGLENGASVEIAGVRVGQVAGIEFKDPVALVKLRINSDVKIRGDDIAAIRTKGIIGDRYVKISRGGASEFLKENETIMDTESVVDIEDIIGKIVHSLSPSEEDEKDSGDEEIVEE